MNAMNHIVNEQLKAAMGAVHILDDAGVTVESISLGEHRPSIKVDRAPATVESALASRITIGSVQVRTRVANIQGCTVHWTERSYTTAQGAHA